MDKIRFKARNLTGNWIEGNFVPQYHSSEKGHPIDIIIYSKNNITFQEEIDIATLAQWVETPSLNIKGIWANSDILQFSYIPKSGKLANSAITLTAVLVWNDDDLSYEFDIYSKEHPEYVCLTFRNTDNSISEVKVIGNIYDNPELIK